MEGLILIVVALMGVGALAVGGLLLFLYVRMSRGDRYYDEPVVYGNLIQCPQCGHMNPLGTAACLNCRYALPVPHAYQHQTTAGYPTVGPQAAPGYYYPPQPPASSTPLPVGTAPQYYTPPEAAPRPLEVTAPNRVSSLAEARVGDPPARPAELPAEMPLAWLEGTSGPIMGHRAVLTQTDTMVGRSTVCDVQVFDPKVSRRHFLIRYSNGGFFLQDQESSRGTAINGERVMAQRLQDGDRIELGDSGLVFRIRNE